MFDPLVKYLEEVPAALNLMSRDDLRMISVVDTVDEVVKVLEPHIQHFRKLHADSPYGKSGAKHK
jgi:predicted Rossmann-fold nucleotide-binding protein